MGGNDKDGYYCSICGDVPMGIITTKRMLIVKRRPATIISTRALGT